MSVHVHVLTGMCVLVLDTTTSSTGMCIQQASHISCLAVWLNQSLIRVCVCVLACVLVYLTSHLPNEFFDP